MLPSHIRKLLPALLLCSSVALSGQQTAPKLMDPAAHPKFDVATVKISDPDDHGQGFQTISERLRAQNERMLDVFCVAFNIHQNQLVNAPDWFETTRFDINGKADQPGIPSWPQQQEMYKALLQERLGLRFHRESRTMPRFTVQVARGGPRLTPARPRSIDLRDQSGSGSAGKQVWRLTNNTMPDFADFLRGFLNRPVVDETGLKGKFDFSLSWARDDAPADADSGGLPGILTAIQEQLGLKVEASQGPTDVIVIDHVDRPSDD